MESRKSFRVVAVLAALLLGPLLMAGGQTASAQPTGTTAQTAYLVGVAGMT